MFVGRRVNRDTVQHYKIRVMCKHSRDRLVHLLERCHACRENYWFIGSRHTLEQRDICHVKRRYFVKRHTGLFQKIEARQVERGRKECDPVEIRYLFEPYKIVERKFKPLAVLSVGFSFDLVLGLRLVTKLLGK